MHTNSFLSIVALSLVILFLILRVIWNLFFHPLASHPGPLLARISCLPSFYHACRGDRHIWTWQCFEIYGSRFRAAPNVLLFRSRTASDDIYGMKANVKKANFYEAWPRNDRDHHTLNTTDVHLHAKKRRILGTAFTNSFTLEAVDTIARHVDQWNGILINGGPTEDGWSVAQDMSTAIDFLVFDIFVDLFFGRCFNTKDPSVEADSYRNIPRFINKLMAFAYPIGQLPFIDLLVWLKPRGLDKIIGWLAPKDIAEYYGFLEESIAQNLNEDFQSKIGQQSTLLRTLYTATNPETGEKALSRDDLLAEANMLMITGSHTTTVALKATLFYICNDPRVYRKVNNEIRTVFQSAKDIGNGAMLSSCIYLRACIDESLRMAPPGASEFPREVLPGGAVIDHDYYPEGIIVGTSGWANGHDQEVYGDANIFRPERWIVSEDGPSAEDVCALRMAFSPFLKGVGSCIAKSLALSELMIVIAKTLHRLDIRMAPNSTLGRGHPRLGWGRRSRNHYQLYDAFAAIGEGPVLQFRERQIERR